jgi:hypothetical protein
MPIVVNEYVAGTLSPSDLKILYTATGYKYNSYRKMRNPTQ